ncbi:protein MALE DISCOVERER 2 isoform X1 [Brachypodium distachyon]|uniref:protein MALE DISCOVERER 2 isoform X1 n=1 Tax=Brachypodium distachyon TaxID=15368 RepID=UPI000D0DAA38|nr:protein MALE DISCOVERER 2 isoform X1 [Brachypodium distachyon]|eukprot:XP_024315666.1 protein MALE DISCOVERER 2 isoform X1 [Brachypodium distachyon]
MENYRRRGPVVCFLFWFLMGFELCASLNHEGLVLLRFKDTIEDDPSHALLDWDEGNAGPCSWFGVECSDDGRVIGLNLANLGLKGVLPPEIGQLTHMHSLILHKNSFYGIIPTEIGDLWDLQVLDLGYNNFHGPIPPELFSLEFLFLKGNRFSGGLPLELNELISHCESQVHQGRTPSNRMPTASYSPCRSKENATIRRILASKQELSLKDEMLGAETSVLEPSDGNPFFSVKDPPQNPTPPVSHPKHALAPPNSPLAPPPSEPVTSPAHTVSPNKDHMSSKESKNKKRSSSKIYAFIGAAICFAVVTLSAAIFFCYRRRKTSIVVPLSPTGSSRQLQASNLEGITSFRRSELETACEGFSNVIGTLPGCTLYKGTLPCGAEIAVVSTLIKYSYRWSPIAEAEFKNKVEVLSQVNHKNFVNLLGYCKEEEPFTRMMVFEYVPNGSLFEHLHVKEAEQLNWQSRLRIAMGVIYCLNHMHQQNPPVILRNLNSSCIYLTEDNAAKVSDISFGGNKKEDEDEFNASDECTTVYKFALLLLESISGRRPFSDDSGLLILWAHRYLTGEKPLMGMVDSTLKAVPEEHVRALTELIIWCISDYPRQRPTLAAVTRRMQEITGFSQDQVIPRNSALWWAELEIITA